MVKLARFFVQNRWLVIGSWLLFIAIVQALAAGAGGANYRDVFSLPGSESQRVFDLLDAHHRSTQAGQTGTIVVHAKSGSLDPRQPPAGLLPALHGLCDGNWHVASVTSPWGVVTCPGTAPFPVARRAHTPAEDNPLLSSDDRVGLVTVTWQQHRNAAVNFSGVHDAIAGLADDRVGYEFTGSAFDFLAVQPHGIPPEVFGFLAALVILTVIFRTFAGAVMPLLCAGAAFGSGTALISLLTHVMDVATFAPQLAQLMVIGVGVDYALFIVTRHRRNLLHGMSVTDSIAVAIDTSGRAVLFAGSVVCIAVAGLCALGIRFLYGVALGTSIAVALTMIASLTLLPAVLSVLGHRVLPRKVRADVIAGTYVPPPRPTRWARWSQVIARRGRPLGAAAAGAVIVLALPFFALRLGHTDESSDPPGSTTRKGFDLIAEAPGFGPGYNSTLELVVSGPGAGEPAYLHRAATALATVEDVNPTSVGTVPLGGRLALITFKSRTSPQDEATTRLVQTLRDTVVPDLETGTADQIYVFGQTAIQIDFAKVLASKMPLFFAAIIGLSFLLLMVAFRSLVLPLTAAIMNLFAAGACFGVIVAIFQWGWLSGLLGVGSGGPIDAFIPVIFFAILFGLSMDYQVFLITRMHEEWLVTGDNARAVRIGQADTGGIITAAAVVMITVFAGFLLAGARVVKLFGIGLSFGIFLDAFVLRTVLVPALMHQLGPSNWWFPRWLGRLTPQVPIEPHEDEPHTPEFAGV